MKDGRLLVTGATGLVGRHVLNEAALRGFEVHAVTSNATTLAQSRTDIATWHFADLAAPGEAARLVASVRPTHLIHAAWDTQHGTYWHSAENLTWVAATAELARRFADVGGKRFVLVGTGAEYDWSCGYMIEGRTPERPGTLYGRCKLAAHHAVHGAAELGFSAATGRIFWCYGPHEQPKRFIPYTCRTLAYGGTPKLGSGRQLRDLLHAEDTARAFVTLVENSSLTGAVNIGGGKPASLGTVANILAQAAGAPERSGLGSNQDRPDDPVVLLPNVDRLLSTGWRPRWGLEEGLRSTYAWWASADRDRTRHEQEI